MTDIEDHIRQNKANTESIDEQIVISDALWEQDIGPGHDGIKADDIEEELRLSLDFEPRTSLGHLVDIDVVEEFVPPGPETLVIATWMDGGDGEVILGRVEEATEEGLEALADDVGPVPSAGEGVAATDGSGQTLRSTMAEEFDLVPDKVENFLRSTNEPVDVLNRAVEAIEETDGLEVGAGYGEVLFINIAHRYRLTPMAMALYEG